MENRIEQLVQEARIRETFSQETPRKYIPLMIANGDVGGCLDPFGGTTYDELYFLRPSYPNGFFTNDQDDIRKLKLTRIISYDFWLIEERHPDRIEAYGAPFRILLQPGDRNPEFWREIESHGQFLNISNGTISTEYVYRGHRFSMETFMDQRESLLIYHTSCDSELSLQVFCQRPCVTEDGIKVYQGCFLETSEEPIHEQGEMLSGESM